MTDNLADGLRFMEALGEKTVDDLTRVEFFTSHEGNEVFVPVHGLRPVTAWSSPIWIEAPGPRSE